MGMKLVHICLQECNIDSHYKKVIFHGISSDLTSSRETTLKLATDAAILVFSNL